MIGVSLWQLREATCSVNYQSAWLDANIAGKAGYAIIINATQDIWSTGAWINITVNELHWAYLVDHQALRSGDANITTKVRRAGTCHIRGAGTINYMHWVYDVYRQHLVRCYANITTKAGLATWVWLTDTIVVTNWIDLVDVQGSICVHRYVATEAG